MKPNQIRVGTFNLQNLALPEKEYSPGQKYTQEEYKKKLAWTGQQLDRMTVDSEIESTDHAQRSRPHRSD